MQRLDTEFTDSTFTYTQIERHGDIAIYEQRHRLSGVVRYEVVAIRIAAAHTWPNGTTSPEREVCPGATSWGRLGHSFFALETAQRFAGEIRYDATAQTKGDLHMVEN